MSRKRRTLLAIGAGLVLAALAVGGFFATHEKVEIEVREAPSGEARQNPYLAMMRLADRLCCTSYWMRTSDGPDYNMMVTLLADQERDLTPEQVEVWTQWVIDGGHLVLPAPQGPASEHIAPLIVRLGFSPAPDLEDEASGDQALEEDAPEDDPALAHLPEDAEKRHYSTVGLPGGGLDWTADDADWIAIGETKNTTGVFAASRRIARGRVTVLYDASSFRNDSIGEREYATMIVDIFELPTDTITPENPAVDLPTVNIVLYSERQSWMAYVFGHIWPFFAVIAVILALAIQHGRVRFGPMLAGPPEKRRSRLEHIEATGRFLWRMGASATLVESAQRALLRELERKHPGLSKAEPRERNTIVAELLDIPLSTARDLLRPPSGSQNTQSFARRIRQLEEHRRQL